MIMQLKLIQYKSNSNNNLQDLYIVIRNGRYSHYSSVGQRRTGGLLEFNESFSMKHTQNIIEIEVWDYWLEHDMLIGKGFVDVNQKHELIMVAIKN